MKPTVLAIIGAALLPLAAQAQGVGIGVAAPAAGAMLEVKSSSAGLLIPRLTAAQRTAIASPPQGLMVYQTDGSAGGGPQTGFWYYAGSPAAWVYLSPAAGGGGLTLPYSGTYAGDVANPALSISATNGGVAVYAATPNAGVGFYGISSTGAGVYGEANGPGGYGVRAKATGANSAAMFGVGFGEGIIGSGGTGPGLHALSDGGPALLAEKPSGVKGRLAEFTSLGTTNDSTGVYVSTAGARPALRVLNTSVSGQAAIRGVKQGAAGAAGSPGAGVEGIVTGSVAPTGAGVRGIDQSSGTTTSGVRGQTTTGFGVFGTASGSGYGVGGDAISGPAIYGRASANGTLGSGAVVGNNISPGKAATGVYGATLAGYGVRGEAKASGGYGVGGVAIDSYGVYGTSTSGEGVYGLSTSSYGVHGVAKAGNTGTAAGVLGTSQDAGGVGVLGRTGSGYAVRGEATGDGGYGVIGTAGGNNGIGVYGVATGGAAALYGVASGTGRAGYFNQNSATYAGNAVEVQSAGLGTAALFNQSNDRNNAPAVRVVNAGSGATLTLNSPREASQFEAGTIDFLHGSVAVPYGRIRSYSGNFGPTLQFGTSFRGTLSRQLEVYGLGVNVYGDESVSGSLFVSGSLSKGGGSFKIDHPLDPENQYLYHSFVESPDMLNIYNGNVTLDAKGEATVTLPDWFEALNRDFRYQLTPIGAAFTPYVLAKVRGNQFRIAGRPGAEVSWQVTGIRHDKWAEQNRIPVEQAKEPQNRGRYLHPAAFGQPASRGIGRQPAPAALAAPAPGSSPQPTATAAR